MNKKPVFGSYKAVYGDGKVTTVIVLGAYPMGVLIGCLGSIIWSIL